MVYTTYLSMYGEIGDGYGWFMIVFQHNYINLTPPCWGTQSFIACWKKPTGQERIHQLQVQHIVNLLVEPVGTFRYMGLTGLLHIKT